MKIKPSAILFDLDGVLIDSLDAWWFALNKALKDNNYNEISKEIFISKYWGHDLYDNFDTMKIDYKVGYYCNKVYGKYVEKVKIYPSAKNVLKKLKNYKKGIITNTPKDSAEKILKQFDIYKLFNTILTSDDVKMGKPDPEIILKSCEKLNVKPENVIVIGDTDSDVIASKRAGCKIIGVNVKGDYSIKNISEILDYLVII